MRASCTSFIFLLLSQVMTFMHHCTQANSSRALRCLHLPHAPGHRLVLAIQRSLKLNYGKYAYNWWWCFNSISARISLIMIYMNPIVSLNLRSRARLLLHVMFVLAVFISSLRSHVTHLHLTFWPEGSQARESQDVIIHTFPFHVWPEGSQGRVSTHFHFMFDRKGLRLVWADSTCWIGKGKGKRQKAK